MMRPSSLIVLLLLSCHLATAVNFQRLNSHDIKPKALSKSLMKGIRKLRRILPGGSELFDDDLEKKTVSAPCFTPMITDSSDSWNRKCPEECPFFAEDRSADRHCTFQCVTEDKCGEMDPDRPIGSKLFGVCRAPDVQGCAKPMLDGTDSCEECSWGYQLDNGQCYYKYMNTLRGCAVVVALVVTLLVVWIVDLFCRPFTNDAAVQAGLRQREDMKLRGDFVDATPKAQGEERVEEGWASEHTRQPDEARTASSGKGSRILFRFTASHGSISPDEYPLTTNLCTTDVAGPGLTLHFNFQRAIIVWALLMGTGWAMLGFTVDNTLFDLGMKPFGTPRDNCILVAWGYENQKRLMWVKILFLQVAYISSFLLAILHSIRQMRTYQYLDDHYKTMRDYCAVMSGLPEFRADQDSVEKSIATELQKHAGCELVGISIAWNFKDKQDTVAQVVKKDLQEGLTDDASSTSLREVTPDADPPTASKPSTYRLLTQKLEGYLLETGKEPDCSETANTLLSSITSSDIAFVVFQTEADRTATMEKLNKTGFQFEGKTLSFEKPHCEPKTVQWQNFDRSGHAQKVWRLVKGSLSIFGALAGWTLFFYAPYAWSIYNFNYENGKEPGTIYAFAFSMIVVLGNQIMYATCDSLSEKIGFRYRDDREAAYMILYTIATTTQLLLDGVTTYYSAWSIMKGLGFRTYDGRHLSEVKMFPEGFETYAIQRSLAENVYEYGFPSTYLIPFVLEPLLTAVLPLMFFKQLIGTHKEVSKKAAKDLLEAPPMELGRYGDILLDVVIFIMILYFPGAYTAKLAICMVLCHMMIYAWDHYRVLRIIPNCTFASDVADWWSQAMLAPCCGLILSILVFKSNNEEGVGLGLGVYENIFACSGVFILHCIVHLLILVYVVPCFGTKHRDLETGATYQDLYTKVNTTWFNTNPVHCLRSKHVLKESPPCSYFNRWQGD
mmetsp:Transcript_133549/g.243419  ORF Transcript_133549/g.243419 Transcript_133549/m.243419 type:complete len:952 (+) Transcript_133549:126-2981(+)